MALTREDLEAISLLLDEKLDSKLKPVYSRLDGIDIRLDGIDIRLNKLESDMGAVKLKLKTLTHKVNDLALDMAYSERETRKDIRHLNDTMDTVIEILRQNGLVPQLKGYQIQMP